MRQILITLLMVAAVGVGAAPRPYVYRALKTSVVDGDTIRTELDLGFDFRTEQLARLDGIDAPERSTKAGEAVAKYVAAYLVKQQSIVVEVMRRDKYGGRYLARVHGDGECLNDLLLANKLVRVYAGQARGEWPEAELTRIERAANALLAQRAPHIAATPLSPRAATATETVYVTESGEKYHRKGCRFLGTSHRAINIEEARKSYEPCSVCRP